MSDQGMDNEEPLHKRLETALANGFDTVLSDESLFRFLVFARGHDPVKWGYCDIVMRKFPGALRTIGTAIERKFKEEIHSIRTGHSFDERKTVKQAWNTAPVHERAIVPTGYHANGAIPALSRSVTKVVGGIAVEANVPVSPTPIVISRFIAHVNEQDFWHELSFLMRGRWRKHVVRTNITADHRKIIELKARGVPVTSDNAMELVRYLHAYEVENEHALDSCLATNTTGWQGLDCEYGFLCGTRQIKESDEIREIEFHGSGESDDVELDGIVPHGTLDGWLELAAGVEQYPLMQLAIYAAVSAPLLRILDCGNAFIEWAGRTSRGKTTALRLAQSCWRSGSEHFVSWNTTQNALEDRARRLNDLPLILDDTSSAQDVGGRSMIAKSVYSLVGGRSRGRAARDGSERKRASWRTVVLTTGEQPISSYARAEGAAARCLSLIGNPLKEVSAENAKLADQLRVGAGKNYGHVGPRVVRWLCENRDQWDTLRKDYAAHVDTVRTKYPGPASSRIAEVVALLEVAASVLHQAIEMPWRYTGLCESGLFAEILGESVEHTERSADRAEEAMQHMLSVANARPQSWRNGLGVRPMRGGESPAPAPDPPGGWLGTKDDYANKPKTPLFDPTPEWRHVELNWHPHALRRVLEEGGYEYDSVLRAWREMLSPLPHLVADKGRFTRKVTVDEVMQRVVTVRLYLEHEEFDE